MKKSRAVPLILLGTLTLLAGCGSADDREVRQNQYKSAEDCKKDWGNDSRDCQPRSGGGGGFVGPSYIWNHASGYPMAIGPGGETRQLSNSYLTKPGSQTTATSATKTTVSRAGFSGSRGGFGSTGRGFSSGG